MPEGRRSSRVERVGRDSRKANPAQEAALSSVKRGYNLKLGREHFSPPRDTKAICITKFLFNTTYVCSLSLLKRVRYI